MIKVGVIGCGKIAQVRHIPEYADNPNAQLAGFFDLNQKRAAELAAKYGGIATRIAMYNALGDRERMERYGSVAKSLIQLGS